MKTSTATTLALSVAALIASGATALAAEPLPAEPAPQQSIMDPATDESGALIFGFNIAFAGNTPAAVQNFIAGLTPEQQQSVVAGCNEVKRDASLATNFTVVQFCHNALS
jgi:hypothetical protein